MVTSHAWAGETDRLDWLDPAQDIKNKGSSGNAQESSGRWKGESQIPEDSVT